MNEPDIEYSVKNVKEEKAVEIINAVKSYGKLQVLKGLNLNVTKGSIYGLLGPSGCGKTTVLRSIVAKVKLDDGDVLVFNKEPGSVNSGIPGPVVGYMPQEIALYSDFTIEETLNFFGYLHNIKKDNLERQKNFLFSFLDLAKFKNSIVKNLSGGQKRRVSMMCALLQEPKLLILDEPTVGVDPLLREKIWEHLVEIANTHHTTIIITTHYIEEARKANRVGLMRNGRILAEDHPDCLLRNYNQTSLENVFLDLCVKDNEVNTTTPNQSVNEEIEKVGFENPNYAEKPTPLNRLDIRITKPKTLRKTLTYKIKHQVKELMKLPKKSNIKGLLYKNSILLRRDIGFLFMEFLIPIMQISLFCLCIGREPYDLHFGIVNNETIYNVSEPRYSDIYVNYLDNRTFVKEYMNWDDAYHMTKNGKLWGFFDLSRNFSQDTDGKFNIFGNPNASYPGSNINLYLDATNQQIAILIQIKATDSYQKFLAEYLRIKEFPISPETLQSPVIIQPPIYGRADPQFIDFMAPGIMTTIIFSLSMGLTSLMFVLEKKEGLFERCGVAGVTTFEIMIAHVLVKLIIITVQIVILLTIATLVFNVAIRGSVIISAILLMLQGFCGMSYGLTISSFSDTEVQVLEIAIGTIFPSLLLSGIIWPIEGMAKWVRVMTNFSPLTHTAEAMRSVASRGWGLTQFSVWFGLVVVILWSAFFNLVAAVVFNIRNN